MQQKRSRLQQNVAIRSKTHQIAVRRNKNAYLTQDKLSCKDVSLDKSGNLIYNICKQRRFEYMSIFDGFTSFNFEEGVPYVSITKNGVTFNKAVIMKLGYPEFVQLLINPTSKQIAIKACAKSEPNSTSFFKKKENSNVLSVRWNVKDLLNTLQEITGWELSSDGYRVDGVLIKEETAMLFDLNNGKVLI